MAMTIQQAKMRAMQLRADRPELQNMAVDDLIAQVMATEGMGAPGAGGGGLADIFQPATVLTPSSPAPMAAARLQAPKPTSQLVPVSNARRVDPTVPVGATGRTLVVDPQSVPLAPWQEEMIAGMQAGKGTAQTDARESAVAAAEPAAAPAPAEEAPEKPKYVSRFRPQFEQAKAELDQLKATVPAGAATPPELASRITNLSGVVTRLQGLVAAEEGAVVDAERAALLERQAARLGREEELVEQARKRSPFDALIAGGAALAGAKPGESFGSALARGLQAGSEKYTGARDAREAALRGIEEKRDAYALQKMDALQAARDKAIALSDAGVKLSQEGYAMSKLSNDDIVALSTRDDVIKTSKATASKAETEALYAPRMAEAELESEGALADYRRRPPQPRGGSGDKGMTENQRQTKISALSKERRGIMIELNDPMTLGPTKAALRVALKSIDGELLELRGTRPNAAPAKAAPAKAAPPVKGARLAPDGKYYVPDPKRQGKWLQVTR